LTVSHFVFQFCSPSVPVAAAARADLATADTASFVHSLKDVEAILDGITSAGALVLGANAVPLGRASLYGLAAAGEAAFDHVLYVLKEEVDRTLAQIGCQLVLLSPDYVMGD
jgi:FMN-dependent dehydrogenase